jgi:hypothetical protein
MELIFKCCGVSTGNYQSLEKTLPKVVNPQLAPLEQRATKRAFLADGQSETTSKICSPITLPMYRKYETHKQGRHPQWSPAEYGQLLSAGFVPVVDGILPTKQLAQLPKSARTELREALHTQKSEWCSKIALIITAVGFGVLRWRDTTFSKAEQEDTGSRETAI